MYNLSARTKDIVPTTGENVGPSTYVICSSYYRKKNVTPFLSSTPRTQSFVGKTNTDAYYDFDDHHRIIGGSSIRNKSERFVGKQEETPGPALYNPRKPKWKRCPKMDPTKPKIYVCRVPYSSSASAPSVPTKVDENGYDLDSHENLIKIPPDVVKSKYFHVISGKTYHWESYKGCKWSERTSLRFGAGTDDTLGPGPAAYDLEVPPNPHTQTFEEYREMARLFTFIPRYIEAQELKTKREGLPGPGSYNVSTPHCSSMCRSKSVNPRPFVSGAPRFGKSSAGTPGPDQYTIGDPSAKHKPVSRKCSPFGFDSPRFRRDKGDPTPGPASYSIKSPLHEKLRSKKNPFSLVQPAFNKMAKRDLSFVARDAAFTPSPADYPQLETEADEEESTEISASVFMSAVERFPRTCKKDLSSAKYSITEPFNKNRSPTSWNTGNAPFNSFSSRILNLGVRFGEPGPADFCHFPEPPHGGCPFNTWPRFKCHDQCIPGPGTYLIHPSFDRSTYKAIGTNNLRLKENVLRKKLRLAPRETRDEWMSLIKRKKKLNWFLKRDLDQEEQLIQKIEQLFDL